MERNSQECRSSGKLGFGSCCKLVAMLSEIVAGVQSVCARLIAIPNLDANHILLAVALCVYVGKREVLSNLIEVSDVREACILQDSTSQRLAEAA